MTSIIALSFLFSGSDRSVNELNFLSNMLASTNLGIPVVIIRPVESTSDMFAEDRGDIWFSKNRFKLLELIPTNMAPLNFSFVLLLLIGI